MLVRGFWDHVCLGNWMWVSSVSFTGKTCAFLVSRGNIAISQKRKIAISQYYEELPRILGFRQFTSLYFPS